MKHVMIESLMILLFELIGTAMLTMLFIAVTPNAIPGVGSLGAVGLGMFIGFFILLILSARISGSHYNPIVTLAFMLRKDAG
jgi:glycerol uptake facilitator-like aquaporin